MSIPPSRDPVSPTKCLLAARMPRLEGLLERSQQESHCLLCEQLVGMGVRGKEPKGDLALKALPKPPLTLKTQAGLSARSLPSPLCCHNPAQITPKLHPSIFNPLYPPNFGKTGLKFPQLKTKCETLLSVTCCLPPHLRHHSTPTFCSHDDFSSSVVPSHLS